MKILDLGCGPNKYKSDNPEDEVVGLDYVKLPGVDIVADMDDGIPLPDNSVDMVVSSFAMGHVKNFFFVMDEIFRVCKPGAPVRIKEAFYSSERQWNNPTQLQFFSPRTFEIYQKGHIRHYYKQVGNTAFKVNRVKLVFGAGRSRMLNPIINPLINRFMRFYIRFFAWSLPCSEIHYDLEVDKE
jgi:SAM-dependent methyltransferase